MKRRLSSVLPFAVFIAGVLTQAAGAAPNPCKGACKAAKLTCVADVKAVFAADKGACALAPAGAERKSCKQSARAAFAAGKADCKAEKLACAAACAAGTPTTTTLPGAGTTTTLAGGVTTSTSTTLAGSTTTTSTLPGPTCGDAEAVAVRGITNAHDAVRENPSLHSDGTAQPVPDPAIAPLCYSAEVAAVAQAWADGCHYMHNAGRGNLGENIYAEAGTGSGTAKTPVDAVRLWSAEAEWFDYDNPDNCTAPNPPGTCLHYTQVVWRDTTSVGCGLRRCTTNSPFGPSFPTWTYVVCDYAPPGNVTICAPPQGCALQKPY